MAQKAYAYCTNCGWKWNGLANSFGEGTVSEVLRPALCRIHYENQPGPANEPPLCDRPDISVRLEKEESNPR
jgi:hypothetical protein